MALFLKYFSRVLLLLLVIPVTNCARGLAAKWMGDDTAEQEGRITLNPLVHLDPIGALAMLLIGFGWGRQLPINPARMNDPRKGIIVTSLAGPVSHFLFAYLGIIAMNIMRATLNLSGVTPAAAVYIILQIVTNINICLGVINILPIPPMDGFQVLNQLAGANFHRWYYSNYRIINQASTVIILLLFMLPNEISPLVWLITWVQRLLFAAGRWVFYLF
ncbi:MAG: site-2 protease family protein [Ruminococcus sp.]|nr:site-2 protease family protein [Ruminococcus sp.]